MLQNRMTTRSSQKSGTTPPTASQAPYHLAEIRNLSITLIEKWIEANADARDYFFDHFLDYHFMRDGLDNLLRDKGFKPPSMVRFELHALSPALAAAFNEWRDAVLRAVLMPSEALEAVDRVASAIVARKSLEREAKEMLIDGSAGAFVALTKTARGLR